VLPHVPLRQFVLALPFDLHLRAARDGQAQSALLTLFVEELGELLRGLTRTGAEARCGSVTFVQLFGSSLNLHVQRAASPFRGLPSAGARRGVRARR
jgi:hypothetical protein